MSRIESTESDERSLPQLLSEVTSELSLLVRKELELAKVETKDEIRRAAKAGGMLGGTGFTGYFALLFLSFAAAWGLDALMWRGLAFLIVGLVYGAIAAALFFAGRRELKEFSPVPEQTVETLKEDVEWAKARKK
jgi:hypothetical protein